MKEKNKYPILPLLSCPLSPLHKTYPPFRLLFRSMTAIENTLICKKSSFRYLTFGTGKTLLLALHGFSNTADIFLPLADVLEKKYTVVALDLPYHGRTKISGTNFRKADMTAVLREIIALHPHCDATELMGYSFGGRLSLGLFDKINARKLWLLAPDGLERRRGYNRFPKTFRQIIARKLEKPQSFLKLLSWLENKKIVPTYSRQFMEYQLLNDKNRKRAMGSWMLSADFKSDRADLLRRLKKYQPEILMVYGKYDRIISAEGGKSLAQQYDKAEVKTVERGHHVFGRELKRILQQEMNKF